MQQFFWKEQLGLDAEDFWYLDPLHVTCICDQQRGALSIHLQPRDSSKLPELITRTQGGTNYTQSHVVQILQARRGWQQGVSEQTTALKYPPFPLTLPLQVLFRGMIPLLLSVSCFHQQPPSPPFIHILTPLTIITGKGGRRRDGRGRICPRDSLWNRKLHRAAPILQSQGEGTLMLRNWSLKRGKKHPLSCAALQLTLSMVQNGFRAKDFISRCRSVRLQFDFCR